MSFIYEILGTPLGYIVWAIYQFIANYGIAIIIFTIILRLCLVPLAIKQQKSTAKMSAFQPLIQEINKKYAKNPQKKNEELQKLYTEEGYSPMSGCLPTILQFVVLFGIIDVVYRPMTHILHLSSDLINQAITIFCNATGQVQSTMTQLLVVQDLQADPSKYMSLGSDFVNSVQNLGMNFLGLNMGVTPEFASITVIIPILAGVFSFLQIFLSMKSNPTVEGAPGGKMMKVMMFAMPLFSVWITFTVPIGVGIYWITTYIFMTVQVLVLNKIYNPQELREQAMAEMQERRKNKKKKVVVKQAVKKNGSGEVTLDERTMTQKEIDRQRLAAARKRDAEKYGEEYIEVTDDDLRG